MFQTYIKGTVGQIIARQDVWEDLFESDSLKKELLEAVFYLEKHFVTSIQYFREGVEEEDIDCYFLADSVLNS
jgi:hypothetical protein